MATAEKTVNDAGKQMDAVKADMDAIRSDLKSLMDDVSSLRSAATSEAKAQLEAEGIGTSVVSMPCMELFAAQPEEYRRKVLPAGPVRVGIEAAVRQGWDQWLLGERGKNGKADFVGMDSFGASAPAGQLFEKFGITAENVANKVKAML